MAKGFKKASRITAPGNGKIPTVTLILLHGSVVPKARLPKYKKISGYPQSDLEKLAVIAQRVLEAGAGIITIDRAGTRYELGLRPRVAGDSSRHAVQIRINEDYEKALTDGLKAIGCVSRKEPTTVASSVYRQALAA